MGECSGLYVAEDIRTPEDKVLADMKTYALPNVQVEQIKKIQSNPELWQRLVRLAERLEFVNQIDLIRQTIMGATRCSTVEKAENVVVRYFHCTWLGADFSGADKDFESLEIFLLITLIEEIVQDKHFVSFENWLLGKLKNDEKASGTETVPISADILSAKIDEYRLEYGMMKGMRKAFKENVDQSIRDQWLTSYCALKANGFGNTPPFDKNDLLCWDKETDERKLEKIMDALAERRNKYAHSAFRGFECSIPVENRNFDKTWKLWLLRRGEDKPLLIPLLKKTIQSIAFSFYQSFADTKEER